MRYRAPVASPSVPFGNLRLGAEHPPLVVAELSGNHGGSLERALALVDAVADAGCRAVKLQTYTPEGMVPDGERPELFVDAPASPWHGERLRDLYARAMTPWEWHAPLFARARERGLLCFSTPFDGDALARLETLAPPAHKIASFELVDLALVRRAAATGRTLVLSTGMATLEEIDEAVDTARGAGCRHLVLLRCTSAYPADARDADLAGMEVLARRHECPVGLSDHTPGIGVAVAAVALGACLVEKHVALARADGDVDGAFSLEPAELAQLAVEVERAWRARGTARFGPTAAERPMLAYRRSLWFARALPRGHELGADDVVALRPATGLPPRELEALLGRPLARDVARGEPVRREDLAS